MVTLADRQYTLENFYSFVESCARNNHSLPEQTYKQITYLAEKVGAPTYSRTPNFKRGGRQKQKYKCSPENWEAMRNFKATTITHAFILNALASAIISALSIEMRVYLDDQDKKKEHK